MNWKDKIERLRTERSVYDAELCDEAADEIERLRGEIIKLQFQGGTVDRQALENNVQRGKKIASLQADNELLSKLNQEYGAEIERLRDALERIEQLDERMAPITNMVRAKEIAREALREVDDE